MKICYTLSTFVVALLVISNFTDCRADNPNNLSNLDYIASATVKTIDEFIARFNGDESHPDVDDSLNERVQTIASLFDYGENAKHPAAPIEIIQNFVDTVISCNSRLKLDDEMVWCEVPCDFTYSKKPFKATLLLRQEHKPDGQYRWGIVGVKGLDKAHLYSDRAAIISPVDHELGFTSLYDWFNSNSSNITALRSQQATIDQLSFLLGLALAGKVEFKAPLGQTFHILSVPGFIFRVERVARNTPNSGWLISYIEPASDFNKLEYINNLFSNQ